MGDVRTIINFATLFAAFATFLAAALTGNCFVPFLTISEVAARSGRI